MKGKTSQMGSVALLWFPTVHYSTYVFLDETPKLDVVLVQSEAVVVSWAKKDLLHSPCIALRTMTQLLLQLPLRSPEIGLCQREQFLDGMEVYAVGLFTRVLGLVRFGRIYFSDYPDSIKNLVEC